MQDEVGVHTRPKGGKRSVITKGKFRGELGRKETRQRSPMESVKRPSKGFHTVIETG